MYNIELEHILNVWRKFLLSD